MSNLTEKIAKRLMNDLIAQKDALVESTKAVRSIT